MLSGIRSSYTWPNASTDEVKIARGLWTTVHDGQAIFKELIAHLHD